MDQLENSTIPYAHLPEIVVPLLRWYDQNARILPWRENQDPYPVWISEIMLQQTRVEAVIPYFERWMQALPDLASLAAASEAEVLKLWEGLGYYSRVRNIHKAAKLVTDQYNGRIPASFAELRKLPGIGEYTAGSVGSIAFGLPVPCVDGNVLRVIARLTADDSDIGSASVKKQITARVSVIVPEDRPGDFNQAMMELGATVCLPNGIPRCEICPLAHLCMAKQQGLVTELPVKAGKPQRRVEQKTVVVLLRNPAAAQLSASGSLQTGETSVILHDNTPQAALELETALRKRPETGLLAGLWEFPHFEGTHTEEETRKALQALGITADKLQRLPDAKHVFTHIEWEMTGYLAVADPSDTTTTEKSELQWFSLRELKSCLTLPAAFKTYYQILKNLGKGLGVED